MGFESQNTSLNIKLLHVRVLSSQSGLLSLPATFLTTAAYVVSPLLASLSIFWAPKSSCVTLRLIFSNTFIFKHLPCCLWFKVSIQPPGVQGSLQPGHKRPLLFYHLLFPGLSSVSASAFAQPSLFKAFAPLPSCLCLCCFPTPSLQNLPALQPTYSPSSLYALVANHT